MKKVLVTGASGNIGVNVIKYLLSEGKYEITALDLKNKKAYKQLKRYKNRINIVYGDILDEVLIKALVKDHDYVIHLASVMPPYSDFYKTINKIVDYEGTLNIINAINKVNKDCFLIYASTTSINEYNLSKDISKKDKLKEMSSFSYYKYETEQKIIKKLNNYTIFRLPLILTTRKDNSPMFMVSKNDVVEVSTSLDTAYAFVRALKYLDKLNKKIFNIGLGKEGIIKYEDFLINYLDTFGLSFRYIITRLFLDKSIKSPVLDNSDDLDNLIHYRHDSLYNYYRRLQTRGKRRIIARIIAKPLIMFKKKG